MLAKSEKKSLWVKGDAETCMVSRAGLLNIADVGQVSVFAVEI